VIGLQVLALPTAPNTYIADMANAIYASALTKTFTCSNKRG